LAWAIPATRNRAGESGLTGVRATENICLRAARLLTAPARVYQIYVPFQLGKNIKPGACADLTPR
jgi:hypothetical protein